MLYLLLSLFKPLNYFKDKQKVTVLGSEFTIRFRSSKSSKSFVSIEDDVINVFTNGDRKHGEILNKWFRDVIYDYIIEKVNKYSEKFSLKFNRVVIKNVRSHWGSCSNKKNLNFNWLLIFMPIKCIDYVVIHELCHIREMNHSYKFWDLLEKCMPDYKLHRKMLKIREKDVFNL